VRARSGAMDGGGGGGGNSPIGRDKKGRESILGVVFKRTISSGTRCPLNDGALGKIIGKRPPRIIENNQPQPTLPRPSQPKLGVLRLENGREDSEKQKSRIPCA